MHETPFERIELPPNRTRSKPRQQGLTSIDDAGLGPSALGDLLLTAGACVDLARLTLGSARLLDAQVLRRKLDAYRARGVSTCADGLVLEHARIQGADASAVALVAESARLGFSHVEISDTLAALSVAARAPLVEAAAQSGLGALARIGAGREAAAGSALADEAAALVEAGCERVAVAASALVSAGEPKRATLAALSATLDASRLLFELPRTRAMAFAGILVRELGVDVGIGAVAPANVMELESLRSGLAAERLSAGARRVLISAET